MRILFECGGLLEGWGVFRGQDKYSVITACSRHTSIVNIWFLQQLIQQLRYPLRLNLHPTFHRYFLQYFPHFPTLFSKLDAKTFNFIRLFTHNYQCI